MTTALARELPVGLAVGWRKSFAGSLHKRQGGHTAVVRASRHPAGGFEVVLLGERERTLEDALAAGDSILARLRTG